MLKIYVSGNKSVTCILKDKKKHKKQKYPVDKFICFNRNIHNLRILIMYNSFNLLLIPYFDHVNVDEYLKPSEDSFDHVLILITKEFACKQTHSQLTQQK